jgi:hypothetical protein
MCSEEGPALFYFRSDGHLTPRGTALVAQAIAAYLEAYHPSALGRNPTTHTAESRTGYLQDTQPSADPFAGEHDKIGGSPDEGGPTRHRSVTQEGKARESAD